MTGHNHHASCMCGWCVNLGGRVRPIIYRSADPIYCGTKRPFSFTSYSSFTIPNASCPVCGSSVYFYQSPSGGRVFFDELGPPWPKHPCTDNPSGNVRLLNVDRVLATSGRHDAPADAQWVRDGWEPINIRSSRMDGGWHAVPVSNLRTGLHFDALSVGLVKLTGEICAFMKPWDQNGWSVISYINLDNPMGETIVPIFERRRFRSTSSFVSAAARRRAEEGANLGASD